MKVERVNRPQHFNSCLAATDTAVLILGIHHKEQHKHLQGKEKEFSHWWPRNSGCTLRQVKLIFIHRAQMC